MFLFFHEERNDEGKKHLAEKGSDEAPKNTYSWQKGKKKHFIRRCIHSLLYRPPSAEELHFLRFFMVLFNSALINLSSRRKYTAQFFNTACLEMIFSNFSNDVTATNPVNQNCQNWSHDFSGKKSVRYRMSRHYCYRTAKSFVHRFIHFGKLHSCTLTYKYCDVIIFI